MSSIMRAAAERAARIAELRVEFEAAMERDDLSTALNINTDIVALLMPPNALKKGWAKRHGLRQSDAGGDPVAWLAGKRLPFCVPDWFDHGTRWTMAGLPYCLVGQPYGLGTADIRELAALQLAGFEVDVNTYPAWHFPGQVLHVEVKRAGT